jgi:hypothetical protein
MDYNASITVKPFQFQSFLLEESNTMYSLVDKVVRLADLRGWQFKTVSFGINSDIHFFFCKELEHGKFTGLSLEVFPKVKQVVQKTKKDLELVELLNKELWEVLG